MVMVVVEMREGRRWRRWRFVEIGGGDERNKEKLKVLWWPSEWDLTVGSSPAWDRWW